jgi:hypothetical protein
MPPLIDDAYRNLSAASARLAELRHRMVAMLEWCVSLLVLGAVLWLIGSPGLALSVAAGAIAALVIGGLALDERRRLVLGLVAQGDAYSIPQVRALADRFANDPSQRRRIASSLRTAARAGRAGIRAPMMVSPGRVVSHGPRLLALATAFEDERRVVSPSAMALCRTLLSDGAGSPLYNPNLPERDLDRVLAAVEAGITAPTLGREARPALTPGQRSATG